MRRSCFIGLIISFITLLITWPLWRPLVGLILVVSDPLVPADAIVPLTGGFERARYAAELWQQGYARWFVAPDTKFVGPYGRLGSEMYRELALEGGVIAWHIYETRQSVSSTYTELEVVRDLAQREGWRSLIVVTTPQHTRRTRMIAQQVFARSGITVSVQPVPVDRANPARWWENEHERRMTLMEYAKIAAFLAGYRGR